MSYTVRTTCACGRTYKYESDDGDQIGMCDVCFVDELERQDPREDHSCSVLLGGDDPIVRCNTCGQLGNTGAMDASDARGVARRHKDWHDKHGH